MICHYNFWKKSEGELLKGIDAFIEKEPKIISHTIYIDKSDNWCCDIIYDHPKDTNVSNLSDNSV